MLNKLKAIHQEELIEFIWDNETELIAYAEKNKCANAMLEIVNNKNCNCADIADFIEFLEDLNNA